MAEGEILASKDDVKYTRKIVEAIDYCKSSIHVIGTDLNCLNYSEILHAITRTRKDGIPIRIYFNTAAEPVIRWLKESKVELYRGTKKFSEQGYEYVIEDESKVIEVRLEGKYRTAYWTTDIGQAEDVLSYLGPLTRSKDTVLLTLRNENIVSDRKVEVPEISESEVEDFKRKQENVAREIGKSLKPGKIRSYKSFVKDSNRKSSQAN